MSSEPCMCVCGYFPHLSMFESLQPYKCSSNYGVSPTRQFPNRGYNLCLVKSLSILIERWNIFQPIKLMAHFHCGLIIVGPHTSLVKKDARQTVADGHERYPLYSGNYLLCKLVCWPKGHLFSLADFTLLRRELLRYRQFWEHKSRVGNERWTRITRFENLSLFCHKLSHLKRYHLSSKKETAIY